jgi:hypothetical protein
MSEVQVKKRGLSFWQALSFAIGSTWATRPKPKPVDPEKSERQFNGLLFGALWYFTH